MMMKRPHALLMLLLVAVIPGTAHAGANAATIVRSLIPPKRTLHESTRGTPVSWSFRTDGTFRASALTGLASWSATGEWKELPDGSVLKGNRRTKSPRMRPANSPILSTDVRLHGNKGGDIDAGNRGETVMSENQQASRPDLPLTTKSMREFIFDTRVPSEREARSCANWSIPIQVIKSCMPGPS